jgi:multicomponent Na+:H+ antiporter subunit E
VIARPPRPHVDFRHHVPLLVWLVLVWIFLWETLTWGNIIAGIVLALVVTRVFYLPPVELSGRFNIYWAGVFLVHFVTDLFRSSWQVARQAFTPGVPRNAVIALDLTTRSDLIMTMTGHALTLIPGSLIVEVDRPNTTLYVHVLDVDSDEDLESARQRIYQDEERLIMTMGTREECARLDTRKESRS